MSRVVYVVLEDVDESYNSIIAFGNLVKAERYALKHSTPKTRLIIDEVVLDER